MESVLGILVGVVAVALVCALVLVAYLARRVSASDHEKSALINRLGDKVLATSDAQLDRMKLDNEREKLVIEMERDQNKPGRTVPTSQLDMHDNVPGPGFGAG